jgi:hypothetical protein
VQAALGTFLDAGFVVLNAADNVSGTLRFAMTQLNPSLPKSGSGTLIVVRLRGKEVNSSTPLTLHNAQLARRDGSVLSTNPVSGRVSVVAATTSSPTVTPIPTQGAGTPMPTLVSPTAEPAAGSTTQQSTPATLANDLSSTITPAPTGQPTAAATSISTQSPTASPTLERQPVKPQSVGVPLSTTTSSEPTITAATSTPVAVVAAVPVRVDSPAASQAPLAVPATSSPESAITFLALSGVVGLLGIAIVWLVTRRRSQ